MTKENFDHWIVKTKKIFKNMILTKNNNKKTRKSLLFASFFVLGCVAVAVLAFAPFGNTQDNIPSQLVLKRDVLIPQKNDVKKDIASLTAAAIDKLDGLPVESIERHEVENSWGTAVYLPQTHRNPGSSVADASNDSARVAQEELYQVAKDLHEEYGIEMIMAEGELYGPANQQGIDMLSKKIEARDKFADQAKVLGEIMEKEDVDPSYRQAFAAKTKSTIEALNREIVLQGAAYKLVAEGEHDDIKLYGSENKDTLDQSADIVRNYIYEQDRLAQLNSGANSQGAMGSPNPMAAMMALLGKSNNPTLNENDFNMLENYADQCESSDMNKSISDLRQAYVEIANLKQKEKAASQSQANSPTPSRANNPYASINDPNRLKTEIAKTEQQIQNVVIDRRNKETAENFANALKSEGLATGMLQYGAGHEDGLVKELNNQGLNVIVVTTKEVAKGELRDNNSQSQTGNSLGQNPNGMQPGSGQRNPLGTMPNSLPGMSVAGIQNQLQANPNVRGQIPSSPIGGGMAGSPSSALLQMIRGMNGSRPAGI